MNARPDAGLFVTFKTVADPIVPLGRDLGSSHVFGLGFITASVVF